MQRATALFLLLLLLLSPAIFSARPEPATTTTITTPSKDVDQVKEGCEATAEEECLMRRTLVAHLDYIYTRENNP
ncbi:hypothetical protein R6Q59_005697 [Mikania micrantha]|uniref:Phytosulfokine n=1 Tax=Mikania micrantha TaxID=192012 RepID=A0A5N6PY68_9ASTR|nr:hypothetical protein E3N88_05039 [Mikania micrantha]